MVCARMLRHDAGRRAGLVGMWLAIFGFILCALATWVWGTTINEKMALTALTFVPIAIAAVGMLRLMSNPRQHWAGLAGLVWLLVVFVLGQLSIWWSWGPQQWEVPQLAAALALMWPLAPLACANAGLAESRWWRLFAMVLLPIATVVVAAFIWKVLVPDEIVLTTAIVATSLAAIGNGSYLIKLQDRQKWLRYATLLSASVCGVILVVASAQRFNMDPWGRFAAASGLAFICGLLAMVVMERLNARAVSRPTVTGEVGERVELACPRCQGRHALKLNGDRCPGCGLLITVKVTRLECCTCSYPLDGITADKCPECGTPVEQTVKAALEEKTGLAQS